MLTSCGGWIWTNDLRVMSPTSFQTAPPRDILYLIICNKKNFITNGQRWIRTTEARCSRFTVCPLWPLGNLPISTIKIVFNIRLWKPMIGLEPITCWLQISCSANWATSAYKNWMGPTGSSPVGPTFYKYMWHKLDADVAQLAEQLICNQQVIGSSPIIGLWMDSRVAKGDRL